MKTEISFSEVMTHFDSYVGKLLIIYFVCNPNSEPHKLVRHDIRTNSLIFEYDDLLFTISSNEVDGFELFEDLVTTKS